MSKKIETSITRANDGMHSLPQYKKAKEMLQSNPYVSARLYHLVFTGSQDMKDYQWIIDQLRNKLDDNGMPCKWKGCYERDEEKGLHFHVFLMVEAKFANPCFYIRYAKDGWLVAKLKERGLGFNISEPKSDVHKTKLGKQQNYATLTKGPKLDDCLIWCSYLYKVRSKDDTMTQIYTSSRERSSSITALQDGLHSQPNDG